MSSTGFDFGKPGVKKDQTTETAELPEGAEQSETETQSEDPEGMLFEEDEVIEEPTEVFGKHEPTVFDREMAAAAAPPEASEETEGEATQAPVSQKAGEQRGLSVSAPVVIGLLGGAIGIQVWLIQGEFLIGAAIFATSVVGGILWKKFYLRT